MKPFWPVSKKRCLKIHAEQAGDGGGETDDHGDEGQRLDQHVGVEASLAGEQLEAADDDIAGALADRL